MFVTEQSESAEVEPEEFLRALLRISPEDAEKVRDAASTKAAHPFDETTKEAPPANG